ncbi:Isoaspartyl peptidase [Cladobotryum mycophilum]|uniref:Isoaspartyl peptidase n=1 Tax=Cladobotryum mycophilum TaxID=491253 RepID=A0ABR0SXU1_9HYPO
MEYGKPPTSGSSIKFKSRLIIHGGAGNILRKDYPPDKYQEYRSALLSIVSKTHDYMSFIAPEYSLEKIPPVTIRRPSALEIATLAVSLLEDHPLFNSGHGAVFTRDGINELEASVMVSRGFIKRGVGVMGLRRVRNPVLLARKMLEHGEQDLAPKTTSSAPGGAHAEVDVPSAQGHTQIHGAAAEALAQQYGLQMVDPTYFFTQQRWDEHVNALEKEKAGKGMGTWDPEEYLSQGTVGAVALDEEGVVCAATSTGGMTNKLTGRIGDTPVVGAGFWAEEWTESGDPTGKASWDRLVDTVRGSSPGIAFAGPLKGLLADCLPTPWTYSPYITKATRPPQDPSPSPEPVTGIPSSASAPCAPSPP